MKRRPLIGTPDYLEARGLARVLSRLATAWRSSWTPRTPPDPVGWIEGGGVIMPASVAARGVGGRLSFRARPYWREPLRWFAQEGVEVIVVEVASQCGKTTGDIALSMYGAQWLAGPGLFLMPSEEHAEDLVRDRLRPIFQASPFGKSLKAADLRLGGVSFPGGGNLNVIGVGSPNALKGRPSRWVLFDEYDECLRYNKAAGSPLERARTRMRTFGSLARLVLTSTPTVEDDGIHPEYERSRRHVWHVPCPHCGEHQELEMGQIKWPRLPDGSASMDPDTIAAQDLAWYECLHCSKRWTNAQRLQAIANGRIHCLDPERPIRQMGLHVSVLYSPDVALSAIAAQFLSSLQDPERLKQFRNEWLALPLADIVRTSSTDQAHLASKGYAGYEMPAPDWWRSETPPVAPEWVRAVTWGFDVQGSEAWGLCLGWGDYGEKIILWSGKFAGATDLEDAAYAYARPWVVEGGELVRARRGMMDSGYRTHEVYRVCAKTPGLIPSKGRQDGSVGMMMSQVDRQDGNRRTVGRTELAILWTTYWQDQVAAGLDTEPGRGRKTTHLPMHPPAELYRHLCAERKKRVKRRDGQVVEAWVAHDSQNHLRDCLAYATAAAGLAGVLEMRPRVKVAEPMEDHPDPVGVSQPATAPTPAPPRPKAPSALQRLLASRNAGNLGRAPEMRRL